MVSFEETLTNYCVANGTILLTIEIVAEITISYLVFVDLWTRVKTEKGTKLPDG